MRLSLVGLDPGFSEYCRQEMRELAGSEWEVIESEISGDLPEAAAYIREFQHDSRLTSDRDALKRTLFLIDPLNLTHLRSELGPERACILLKPCDPSALRPFLEHIVRGSKGASPEKPGSENDKLLECFLDIALKLQEHEKARTNFLARAVHDFRAPLTALGGYCGVLLEQSLGSLNPVQLDLLSRMQHSITRMSRLAEGMFNLAAGHRLKEDLNIQAGDISAAISQAVHEVMPQATEKQIRIKTAISDPDVPLMFDAGKIEQVLINLLENACRFTPRRGTIDISGYPTVWDSHSTRKPPVTSDGGARKTKLPNGYRVDVRDSGMGIAGDHLESIFEEYTSYGGVRDRAGAGLGLAICRMILKEHRGCIWAESSPTGASFSFILPYTAAAGALWDARMRAAGGRN